MAVTQAGLEGIVAAESNICFIDGDLGILSYQGYNIHTLAEHATFEEVIYLLWHGKLPKQAELDALKAELVRDRPIPKEVVEFLGKVQHGSPMDVLRTAVSMLGLYDPKARDNSIEANVEKAARLMAQTSTIVTTFDRLRTGKPVLDGEQRQKALQRLADGASVSAVAREMNASRATIMRVGRAGSGAPH